MSSDGALDPVDQKYCKYFDGKSTVSKKFVVYTFYLIPEYFFCPQVSLKSVQVFFPSENCNDAFESFPSAPY